MIPALLAVALAAGPRVAVDVLAKQAPRSLTVRGGGAVRSVAARGDVLVVDGRAVPALDGRAAPALALPPGRWRVELAGAPPRVYAGALALRAEAGIVRVRADLELEPYVAGVVASEATPDTPPAALEALAVAVRSYALAARDRHAGGALCDLAHCQLLRAGVAAPLRAAAARAARATAGEVLVLPTGELAAAAFHAACGGHTADPREAFGSAASPRGRRRGGRRPRRRPRPRGRALPGGSRALGPAGRGPARDPRQVLPGGGGPGAPAPGGRAVSGGAARPVSPPRGSATALPDHDASQARSCA